MNSAPRPHLPALTSLRFFAAVAVLLFHATDQVRGNLPSLIEGLLRNGFIGVSFFFLLSGFVLTYTYLGRTSTLGDFFVARFARLYPVYVLSLLVAAPLFFRSWIPAEGLERTGALVAGKLLMVQSWIPWMTWNWNVPSWSLSTEAFFYLCFPLLLTLLQRLPAAGRWPAIVGMLTAYAFSQPMAASFEPDYSLAPVRDLFHFGIGILLAMEFESGLRVPKWGFAFGCCMALGLLAGLAPFPEGGWLRMLLSSSLALVIFGAASLEGKPGRLLSASWMLLLGEASYAVYILHSPFAEISLALGRRVGLGFDSWMLITAYCLVTIGVSILVFKGFEAPMNQRIRAWWKARRASVAAVRAS